MILGSIFIAISLFFFKSAYSSWNNKLLRSFIFHVLFLAFIRVGLYILIDYIFEYNILEILDLAIFIPYPIVLFAIIARRILYDEQTISRICIFVACLFAFRWIVQVIYLLIKHL
jgi:hypothetical protein